MAIEKDQEAGHPLDDWDGGIGEEALGQGGLVVSLDAAGRDHIGPAHDVDVAHQAPGPGPSQEARARQREGGPLASHMSTSDWRQVASVRPWLRSQATNLMALVTLARAYLVVAVLVPVARWRWRRSAGPTRWHRPR
ncbi:MAG: hypothetical protein ACRDPR_01135 [Nocardioidaceae bacterium]